MRLKWETKLGFFLIASSGLIYLFKTLFMGRLPETYAYLFNALGFLPINVLLVTLILNKLLHVRAQEAKLEKLNMVIGVFFSEMGNDLLAELASHDHDLEEKVKILRVGREWSGEDFKRALKSLESQTFNVTPRRMNFPLLRDFFIHKRNFLLRLMENPLLYEHESFTDVLRAVFHLSDELEKRKGEESPPEPDLEHLRNDLNRIYERLLPAWLQYMDYQRVNYPYIYSLAIRTNPFNSEASVVVRG